MTQEKVKMKKTLVRFFGGAVMVCGTLLGLPASAHAQSFDIEIDATSGPARQPLAQAIHVTNTNQFFPANNVTVTFRPPKGAKVDSDCQVEHFPGGYRSYTCVVGTLLPGQKADVNFSISMTQSGAYDVPVEVVGDLVSGGALLLITIF
jgi:hypothetical protein